MSPSSKSEEYKGPRRTPTEFPSPSMNHARLSASKDELVSMTTKARFVNRRLRTNTLPLPKRSANSPTGTVSRAAPMAFIMMMEPTEAPSKPRDTRYSWMHTPNMPLPRPFRTLPVRKCLAGADILSGMYELTSTNPHRR